MNKFKLLGITLCATLLCLVVTGCGTKSTKLEGSLTDIMANLYEKAGEEKPMMLRNTELTKDNLSYYLGLDSLDFEEGLASEPGIGSIAHSIVLVRVKDGVDIEKTKQDIKAKVNPRKWICVEVNEKDVIVDNRDDLIILIMVNDTANKYLETFKNL